MMNKGYRVLCLGANKPESQALWQLLAQQVQELGINPDEWLQRWHTEDYKKARAQGEIPLPLAVIYWGNQTQTDLDTLQHIAGQGIPLFPIVSKNDKDTIKEELPVVCQDFQCTFQDQPDWRARLANSILESLSLLRDRRRVFISYKRDEASAVAHQLFDALNGVGYRPFLDTAEITPGKAFQPLLMQQLVDSDLLILLDSPGISQSDWVKKELDQAEDQSIDILYMIWPNKITASPERKIRESLALGTQDFVGDTTKNVQLHPGTLARILTQVEKMRARTVGRRMVSLQNHCRDAAAASGLTALFQPDGLMLQKNGAPRAWLRVIVGIPGSRDFHALHQSLPKLPVKMTAMYYNGSGIDSDWKAHLQWLNQELPDYSLDENTLPDWLGCVP
ncbi:MAG: toll/interleukin-1 receptor domain-containing protein [Magnetococcus sp. DMHC-1]